MSEYREKRTVIEDVPIARRPVVEEQYDTVVHERRGMSGAAIAAIVIAAIAAAVLITLMIMNGNQQSREDELARQRDQAEANARAAQAANQQPAAQAPAQPSVIVVPPSTVPAPSTPAPSASQPAPSASVPAVSDTSIEVDINTKLLDDQDLRTHPIDVKFSGGTAILSGDLPSEDLKGRAEKLAKTVKGVRRVVNNIKVSEQ